MMLRLVTVALLFIVGINAEHRRGIRGARPKSDDLRAQHEVPRMLMIDKSVGSKATGSEKEGPSVPVTRALPSEPSVPPTTSKASEMVPATTTAPATNTAPATGGNPRTGPCLCDAICTGCNDHQIESADCQTVCSFVGEPNCNELCYGFIETGGGNSNRDDPIASSPPLPTTNPTCRCVDICDKCVANGSSTASCRTVCEYAAQETSVCITNCNAAFHFGS